MASGEHAPGTKNMELVWDFSELDLHEDSTDFEKKNFLGILRSRSV
jgi:hypothetical protein